MTTPPPTVALLAGSIRQASLHRRLADVVAWALAERGAEPDIVDLVEYPLPIYHGDDELASGTPPMARALNDRLAAYDGVIVLSPEYNGGPSPLLKNAIDWVTRVDRATLRRPLVGLAATSPGSRGAAHGLRILRAIGEHMRLHLAESDFSLPDGGDAMAADGDGWRLTRDDDVARLDRWLDSYLARLDEHRAGVLLAGEGGTGR